MRGGGSGAQTRDERSAALSGRGSGRSSPTACGPSPCGVARASSSAQDASVARSSAPETSRSGAISSCRAVSAWPGELSRPAHHRPCFPRCWRSTAPRKSSARRDPPAPPDLRDSAEPREFRDPREPPTPPGPPGERTTVFGCAGAVCLRSEGIMRIFHPMPQLCTAKYCPMWIVRGFSPPVSY